MKLVAAIKIDQETAFKHFGAKVYLLAPPLCDHRNQFWQKLNGCIIVHGLEEGSDP